MRARPTGQHACGSNSSSQGAPSHPASLQPAPPLICRRPANQAHCAPGCQCPSSPWPVWYRRCPHLPCPSHACCCCCCPHYVLACQAHQAHHLLPGSTWAADSTTAQHATGRAPPEAAGGACSCSHQAFFRALWRRQSCRRADWAAHNSQGCSPSWGSASCRATCWQPGGVGGALPGLPSCPVSLSAREHDASFLALRCQPCCPVSWPQLQPAPRAPLPAPLAPSLASFGRKRRMSTEAEPASAAPLNQQHQRQEHVGKRQRRVPAPPPSRQPSRQPRASPPGQAAQRSTPATQAEALFDSLFGGPEAVEPEPLADDLAAAVQRQLARSVARHARRVAQSRQRPAGDRGSVWLSQPVEDDS